MVLPLKSWEKFCSNCGPKGLGALFTDTARLPQTFMAILAFSLTDIFDNDRNLIGTGEKLGLWQVLRENHESERLDKLCIQT